MSLTFAFGIKQAAVASITSDSEAGAEPWPGAIAVRLFSKLPGYEIGAGKSLSGFPGYQTVQEDH